MATNDDKKSEPVVEAEVVRKSGLAKWKEVFIATTREDFERDFTQNLLYPGLKELMIRLAHGAIDLIFYDSKGYTPYGYRDEPFAYHRVGNGERRRVGDKRALGSEDTRPIGRMSGGYALDEISTSTSIQANRLLTAMLDEAKEYKLISVYKYFDIAKEMFDIPQLRPQHTDNNYGWYEDDLNGVQPRMNRDGRWYLNLPKPRRLD